MIWSAMVRACAIGTAYPVMSAVPLAGMHVVDPDGVDHLLLTEMLPTTADGAFVNRMTALTFVINAS